MFVLDHPRSLHPPRCTFPSAVASSPATGRGRTHLLAVTVAATPITPIAPVTVPSSPASNTPIACLVDTCYLSPGQLLAVLGPRTSPLPTDIGSSGLPIDGCLFISRPPTDCSPVLNIWAAGFLDFSPDLCLQLDIRLFFSKGFDLSWSILELSPETEAWLAVH